LCVLLVLHVFAACELEPQVDPPAPGTGGTDPTGTGGTDAKGTGGTDPTGQGGTHPTGQGGTAGDEGTTGSAGAGGQPSFAGAAGSGGAAGSCGDDCEPCQDDYVHTECEGDRCVCEVANNPWKQEYQELLACDLDEPCPPSTQYSDPGTFRWEGSACLLTALRDRTPGKYRFSDTFADAGSQTSDAVFLLNGSDEILVLNVDTSGLVTGNLTRNYWPVLSCTLKSYDELDACVAAGSNWAPTTTGGEQPICRHSSDWFQDCEPVENPECPAE